MHINKATGLAAFVLSHDNHEVEFTTDRHKRVIGSPDNTIMPESEFFASHRDATGEEIDALNAEIRAEGNDLGGPGAVGEPIDFDAIRNDIDRFITNFQKAAADQLDMQQKDFVEGEKKRQATFEKNEDARQKAADKK